MIKYYFQGLSDDGKTINGTIEAADEAQAREKLSNAHLAVLTLEVFDDSVHEANEGFLYEFRGTNQDGNIIRGTINAPAKYEAYRQLRSEYGLDLESLMRGEGSMEDKSREAEAGLADLEAQYEASKASGTQASKDPSLTDQEMVEQTLASQAEEKAFLSRELAVFSEDLQERLEVNDLFLNPEKKRNLKENLNQIHRLKQSNNTSHVQKMLEYLFRALADDSLFLPKGEIDRDLQQEYHRSKENFRLFWVQAQEKMQSGVKSLQKVRGRSVNWFDPHNLLTFASQQSYVLCVVLLLFGLLVLLGGLLGKLVQITPLYHLFIVFASSLLFWYLMGSCAFLIVLWALDLEGEARETYRWKWILGSIGFVLYTLNAPTLFFWTL